MVRPFQGKRQDYVGLQKFRALLKSKSNGYFFQKFHLMPKFGIISGPSWSMPPAMRNCPFLGSSSDNQGMLHANFGGFKPRTTHENAQGNPALSGNEFAFHPSFPWKASYVRRKLH